MEDLKNNKELTIICTSCIFLVLALCYFGVNNFVSSTISDFNFFGTSAFDVV